MEKQESVAKWIGSIGISLEQVRSTSYWHSELNIIKEKIRISFQVQVYMVSYLAKAAS